MRRVGPSLLVSIAAMNSGFCSSFPCQGARGWPRACVSEALGGWRGDRRAFISPYQVGHSDESPLIDALVKRDMTPKELFVTRRLWYEASTAAMGELRQKVERSDSTEPVRLAIAERTTRLEEQRKRLNGVHFSSDSEPSYGHRPRFPARDRSAADLAPLGEIYQPCSRDRLEQVRLVDQLRQQRQLAP